MQADTDWDFSAWAPAFLGALADEAAEALDLLRGLERNWLSARSAVAGRRRNSRAAAAVDFLAAAPLLSATTLAAGLGMAIKNAAALLEDFCTAGIAVEVTHRSARRLFGLVGLAPLRDEIAPPRRPMPGRSRGRPPSLRTEQGHDAGAVARAAIDADQAAADRFCRARAVHRPGRANHPAYPSHTRRACPRRTGIRNRTGRVPNWHPHDGPGQLGRLAD